MEEHMSTNINSGGGNSGIAFIVGGLVVVVVAIGLAMAGGIWPFDRTADVNIQVEQPTASAPDTTTSAPAESSGTASTGADGSSATTSAN
jgi:hypothetical protein